MKKLSLTLIMLLCMVTTVNSDDQANLVRLKKKDLKDCTLGIMPIYVSYKLALDVMWKNLTLKERRDKLLSILYRYGPKHVASVSTFTRTVLCTTGVTLSVPLKNRNFTFFNGKKIKMEVPLDGTKIQTSEPVKYLLFLFVDYAIDDRDSSYIDWDWAFNAFPRKKTHPLEECINLGYRYALWSQQKSAIVSIGSGTAEECGRLSERYGDRGALYQSTEDLFDQVMEETPFYGMKDASDFH